MSTSEKKGIHIQDLDLNKVSGPISITLMIPKQGLIAPIILLFGERHEEIKNGCEDIDYKEQFTRLLEKLNDIASNNHFDINFYSETLLVKRISDKIKEGNETSYIQKGYESDNRRLSRHNVGLLKIIADDNSICYYNELRKKNNTLFNEKCKYPFIKWQHNDIRDILHKNKISINNGNLLTNVICSMIVFLSPLSRFYTEKYPNHLTERIETIDKQIKKNEKSTLDFMIKKTEELKKEKEKISNNDINNIISDFFKTLGIKKGNPKTHDIEIDNQETITFNEFVDMLKSITLFYDKNFDSMVDNLLNVEVIKKQIKNTYMYNFISNYLKNYLNYWHNRLSQNRVFVNVNFYVINLLKIIIIFLDNIDDNTNIMNDIIYSDIMRQNFSEIINYINQYNIYDYVNKTDETDIFYGGSLENVDFYADKNFIELSKIIDFEVFIKPFSIMLDIYFILRIFKYKINQPTLICAILGSSHKTNIAEYFNINMNDEYDIYNFKRLSKEEGPLFQCVDTGNNVTNINNEKINNFHVDIYEVLKNQEMLIRVKNTDISSEENQNVVASTEENQNVVASTEETKKGGNKKMKSKTKKKSSKRKYKKRIYTKKYKKQRTNKIKNRK